MTNSDRILKSRDITVDKAPYSQTMLFPVVMYGCDCKEGWLPKNWCFQTEVLEKTFESHLDNKDIKLVIPKGNQPWIFIGRTDTEAEAPIFWPPDEKSQLLGQNSCDRKDWRQKEKRVTEDEMVGWHDQLDGHEFEQTLGNSEEQEACHAAVHGAAKSQMQSSHWTMATMQRICGSVKKSQSVGTEKQGDEAGHRGSASSKDALLRAGGVWEGCMEWHSDDLGRKWGRTNRYQMTMVKHIFKLKNFGQIYSSFESKWLRFSSQRKPFCLHGKWQMIGPWLVS